ncbi:ABC transporter ATP-binding protein [Methanococcus maripaludis]|uniref:Molybdate/tungstate import ATP-binding protein WtpC n=1 Tax=Methanococcus maripaludis (strain DSM 14266 / JCM 13030 / NBRC 101832 / S2 / LL) TaxID=267377 RepID=Q6M0R2_METMP|nr:ABC transporter ATP-binding protein [Methanococcus maripaludis]CAF29763.1 Molybdenum transport ATP-binding protein modC [Methanococcus maripaludis S2]
MILEIDIEKDYYESKKLKKNKTPSFNLKSKFSIDSGSIIVLFGRSGSGKTSTLGCIAGLLDPDNGRIIVNNEIYYDSDKNINMSPQERNLGYVFQNYALFPHLTVKENIEYGIKHLSEEEKERRVFELLKLTQIEGLENRYPDQISGGQKQRVALARALAPSPKILLLDEPFSALDMISRMRLRESLRSIQKELKIPVVFVTHSFEEAFVMAEKVVTFHNGRIQQIGTPEEIFYNPINTNVAQLVGYINIFSNAEIDYNENSPDFSILDYRDMKMSIKKFNKSMNEVSFGIRPENIKLIDINSEKTENVFECIIKDVVNEGSTSLVYLEVIQNGLRLMSKTQNDKFKKLNYAVGEKCKIELLKDKITILMTQSVKKIDLT